jgi:hypothetical protein
MAFERLGGDARLKPGGGQHRPAAHRPPAPRRPGSPCPPPRQPRPPPPPSDLPHPANPQPSPAPPDRAGPLFTPLRSGPPQAHPAPLPARPMRRARPPRAQRASPALQRGAARTPPRARPAGGPGGAGQQGGGPFRRRGHAELCPSPPAANPCLPPSGPPSPAHQLPIDHARHVRRDAVGRLELVLLGHARRRGAIGVRGRSRSGGRLLGLALAGGGSGDKRRGA